jgi:hypothetical protein
VQGLHIHDRLCGFAAGGTENIGRSGFELRFSGDDLVKMDIARSFACVRRNSRFSLRDGAGAWDVRSRESGTRQQLRAYPHGHLFVCANRNKMSVVDDDSYLPICFLFLGGTAQK